VADVSTRSARELWHNAPNDSTFPAIQRLLWAGDRILVPVSPLNDEWERYYSLDADASTAKPVLLTTTNGLIEDATSAAVSADGKTFYYCTNASDIERRHIWSVPTAGGTPQRISTGDGIETSPQPLASGKQLAVLYFDASTPASVGLVPVDGGKARVIFPTLGADFPKSQHVTPEIVIVKSPDGVEAHNQLFLPKDLKAGERRPAIVFVHGGPPRQMMPGYHYMQFYHWAYAVNQWLASQGYVVLSVNYRLGIGYGRSFRQAQNTNARGNAEYQDVLAAASICRRAPTWTRRASGSGDSRMAACSRRRRWRATRICSLRARTSRACTCTAARSTRPRSLTSRPRSRRSTAGSRRCSSCMATMIGTWTSHRPWASCSCCAHGDLLRAAGDPGRSPRVDAPQQLGGDVQSHGRFPPPVCVE
jgi:hypothetical protein